MDSVLFAVVTLAEASKLVNRSKSALMMRIWRSEVDARKSCGVWLITVKSLLSIYEKVGELTDAD